MESGRPPGLVRVELAYLPTRADLDEALYARTTTQRWRLPLIAVLVTATVLVVLLMLPAPKGAMVLAAVGLRSVAGGLVGGLVNRLYRVRQMTRYARSQGEYTMRADDDGVHAATAVVRSTFPWTSFRHYIETVHLFVLVVFVLVVDDTVGGMVLLRNGPAAEARAA